VIWVKGGPARRGFTAAMVPSPLQMSAGQRAMLAEFERLHEEWRQASAAADAIECTVYADGPQGDRLLHQRLAADRLHRQAMQVLRDAPI
jgi:hypothetical protein